MTERERHRQLLIGTLNVMPLEAFDHVALAIEQRLMTLLRTQAGEFHNQSIVSMREAQMWANAYMTPAPPKKESV